METTEIIAELRKAVAIGDSPVFCGGSYIPKRVATEAADALERQSSRLHELSELALRQGEEIADLRKDIEVLSEEVEPVVHAHWIPRHRRGNNWVECSLCNTVGSPFWKRCPMCEAKMDETLEIRTAYCPLCDKHFSVRSNDSGGSCPDCGHHVVLHKEGEE